MKRSSFVVWVSLLASAMTLSGCCWFHGCKIEDSPTLQQQLMGNAYVVKNVTRLPNTDVTQDFKDLKMAFYWNESKCFFRMSTTPTDTLTTNYVIHEGDPSSIVLSRSPTNWANTLSEVKIEESTSNFSFQVHIDNPSTGMASYSFKMWKQ